ncbi:MAG: C39 family peptidase [Moraxella sp.]|nr:C39 family peptidase [Moraxella sp.]
MIGLQKTHASMIQKMQEEGISSIEMTWTSLRDVNVTKQQFDYSCGAASISTILTYFYNTPVNENDVLMTMNIKGLMASFENLAHAVHHYGFIAKGVSMDYDTLSKVSIPVIVHMNYRQSEHFSVVRAIDERYVYLSDASFGNRKLTKKQFLKLWQIHGKHKNEGRVLLILPANQEQKSNINTHFTKITKDNLPLPKIPSLTLKTLQ